ncbi:hypothetical protein F889_01571 [Acinetobacter colistiniresistens]|uniref:Uncharacterized protein n=1 Tax=Acinetobacter colistiniresistens TaxID=280145 RepID=N9QXY2_9GAMM|nr:hypothetical protein [Acinetobacter colistiniresistens]ENX34931.1 hypothetical protein F889_01571 [Acinetobacter colistiniresistens]
MKDSNMNLWQRLCITDPSKVKPITGKSYKGNSPQPYWLVQRATEEFGPCGQGWGTTVDDQGFERFDEHTIMHWALVTFWYLDDKGNKCMTQHMGGTKAMYKTSNGGKVWDEDAPKKSVTDATVKAMSYLGFAGDIFSGQWDDWKYQEMAATHYSNQNNLANNQRQNAGSQNQVNAQDQNNRNQTQQANGQGQNSHNQNQRNNQSQTPKNKSWGERYQDALNSINQAKRPATLDKAIETFQNTQYSEGIGKACQARADQMGWSKGQPMNGQNNQVRQ